MPVSHRRFSNVPLFSLLLLATSPFLSTLALAQSDNNTGADGCAIDVNLDPQNDVCNPLRYIPTLWIAALAMALYFLTAIGLTVQFWRYRRFGGKYFLCLIIGAYCMAFGLLMRIPFRTNPHALGIYITSHLFILLSPCAFIAADYILLGRIVRHLAADRYLPISAHKVSRYFVISDVVTFLIQAGGGGLSTSQDEGMRNIGGNIFLAGVILQLVSFGIFTILYVWFGFQVYRKDKVLWNTPGWKPLFFALGWTCIGFLIRSVYRSIEGSQGFTGYLHIHEPYFYLLDALPLFLAIVVYVWYWPAKYLNDENQIVRPISELELLANGPPDRHAREGGRLEGEYVGVHGIRYGDGYRNGTGTENGNRYAGQQDVRIDQGIDKKMDYERQV